MPTLPQSIDNNVIDLKPVGFFISYFELICSKTYQLSLRRTLVRLVLILAIILVGKNTVDQGGGAHECDAREGDASAKAGAIIIHSALTGLHIQEALTNRLRCYNCIRDAA